MKSVAVAVATCLAVCSPALADGPHDPQSRFAFGVGVSTLGIVVEGSLKVAPTFVMRLNGNWADYDYDTTVDANRFNGSATVWGAGLIGDWHPFQNGFRLSGGVRYHNAAFTGRISGEDITVNGTTYTAAEYGTLVAKVENGNQIAPYLGLGWDSAHFTGSNFTFSVELGAMYVGSPKATLRATNDVPGLNDDLDAELRKIKDEYAKFGQVWPVIAIGAKYRF